jgi:hypothetical protein
MCECTYPFYQAQAIKKGRIMLRPLYVVLHVIY